MSVATLVTGNQIGVELFEFVPDEQRNDGDSERTGYFHVCVIDPDIEGLAREIDANGGDHYAEIWRLYENDKEYRLTYCEDPYGNVIEIYSHN